MKTIYLVRHAKSSWDDPFQDDFDRPLNERGRTDAPRMARRLKEKEIHPDLLLSSPAARAISTCKVIAETAGYHHNQIKTDSRLYHASEETLLQIVKKLSDEIDVVMIFAHNPGLTDFANRLLPEPFRMIKVLKSGGSVALLIDQDTRVKTVFVDFFGMPAATPVGATVLALKTGAAVIPTYIYLGEDGLQHMHLLPEIPMMTTGDEDHDVIVNTQVLTNFIEEKIREHPDQWVWMHERWKTRP